VLGGSEEMPSECSAPLTILRSLRFFCFHFDFAPPLPTCQISQILGSTIHGNYRGVLYRIFCRRRHEYPEMCQKVKMEVDKEPMDLDDSSCVVSADMELVEAHTFILFHYQIL